MASLGLLLLLTLQDPPVHEWMEGLRSDRAEDRTRAFNQLRTLGRGAEPWLRKGARDPDPEIAERSRLLLRTVAIRDSLPPALLREFPGIENRLALDPGEWTAAFLEATRPAADGTEHPSLGWADLDFLAAPALQGAPGPFEIQQLGEIIGNHRLTSALPVLHALLRSPDVTIRRRVLCTLGQMRSASSVAPIADLLDDPELRGEAAWALSRFERRSAVRVLMGEAGSPDDAVRQAVLQVLESHLEADAVPVLRRFDRDIDPGLLLRAGLLLSQLGEDANDIFLPLLQHPLPHIRSQVQYQLMSRRSPALLRRIRPLLQESQPELRASGLWLLASYADVESIDEVVNLLDDPSVQVRRAAITTYRQLRGTAAIPRLARLLSDPAEEVRFGALHALAMLGWKEILPDVAARLRDPEESTRLQAINLLARPEMKPLWPELARLLLDPSPQVQTAVIRAIGWHDIGDLAPALVPFLADPDENRAQQAESALSTIGVRRSLPWLVQGLSHPDAAMRLRCYSLLTQYRGPVTAAATLRLLDDPDLLVRRSATSSVADLSLLAAIPKLRAMLKDPDAELRMGAAHALCTLQATATTADLLPLLADKAQQDALVRSLWGMGGRDVLREFHKLVDNPSEPGSSTALHAIVDLEGQGSLPLLRDLALRDQHPLRMDAIGYLGSLESATAVPDLIRCLEDRSLGVRGAAAQALAAIGAREAVPALLKLLPTYSSEDRLSYIHTLVRLGAVEVGPRVLANLRHEDPSIVRNAIDAAMRLELPEAIPALRALSLGDDLTLRQEASVALTRLGDRAEAASMVGGMPAQMFALNRLRKPELWRRLRSTPLLRDVDRESEESWRQLACDAGFELRLETGLGNRERSVRSRGGATSLLEAIDGFLQSNTYHLILEDGWIRIVDHRTATAFWQAWCRRELGR